jgi:cellulose 1,4-beta-cellobiosidase
VKPCNVPAQINCDLDDCGGNASNGRYGGQCDPDGCDFNPYRMGNTTFYGAGQMDDSTKPITVVTQFITDDGTVDGTLAEIKRFYFQDGVIIDYSYSESTGASSITSDFCGAQKLLFGNDNAFEDHGGMAMMTEALRNGMVLAMMIGDDKYNDLRWLDSVDPVEEDSARPGVMRGTCPYDDQSLQLQAVVGRSASVEFSKIRVGDIDSLI